MLVSVVRQHPPALSQRHAEHVELALDAAEDAMGAGHGAQTGLRGCAGQTTAIPITTTTPAMAAARATLPNTGHRTGLYVVTGPSWIGGSGGWGWIAGFIGASFAGACCGPSLRQSCPHNANCKCTWRKDFRSAWRDGHEAHSRWHKCPSRFRQIGVEHLAPLQS